ncbi:MAG: sulfatase-like hydrolase/transferase, partial [Acidobacteriota bacterium]|nr:sulfatase-like hydrolase/transferase [Acidobacteriota bacterium]
MTERRIRRLGIAVGAIVALFVIAGVVYERRTGERKHGSQAHFDNLGTRTPDILLITIDTLRADATGFSGNTHVETPTLDRLAREGRVFSNAHAHNVVTLPSHANILTGLYPYQHGVRENSGFRLAAGIPTVATLLKA